MPRETDSELNFVKQLYPPRVFGMALAFPAVAVVLYQQQAPWPLWLVSLCIAFLWPHIAYFMSSRSANPVVAEHRNLMIDAAFAGFWVPLLSFNLLPSLVLLSVASLGTTAVGGWRLFSKGLLFALLGLFAGWALVWAIWPAYTILIESSMLTLIAVAPLLVVFPLAVGLIAHELSRKLDEQRSELDRAGRIDELSQLNTRQSWEIGVYKEYERHRRVGSAFSLILLDIDHFEETVDTFGQVAAEQVIRDLAELLSESVRVVDVAGRYSRQEFSLLLPDTNLEGAMQFAERLRLSVQTLQVKPYDIGLTVSLGVAVVDAEITKYQQLIERVEKALQLARRSGRNISTAYQPD